MYEEATFFLSPGAQQTPRPNNPRGQEDNKHVKKHLYNVIRNILRQDTRQQSVISGPPDIQGRSIDIKFSTNYNSSLAPPSNRDTPDGILLVSH